MPIGGQVSCGCHPNCGVGPPSGCKETREMRQCRSSEHSGMVKDMQKITDAARGKWIVELDDGGWRAEALQTLQSPSQFTL